MNYSNIVAKVSKELDLPNELVDKVYKAYWYSIKQLIQELPLKDNLSEEEFNKLKCNFNIPSIGKFSITYDRYKRCKNRFDNAKNKED